VSTSWSTGQEGLQEIVRRMNSTIAILLSTSYSVTVSHALCSLVSADAYCRHCIYI
jgi:hypothetical protein